MNKIIPEIAQQVNLTSEILIVYPGRLTTGKKFEKVTDLGYPHGVLREVVLKLFNNYFSSKGN